MSKTASRLLEYLGTTATRYRLLTTLWKVRLHWSCSKRCMIRKDSYRSCSLISSCSIKSLVLTGFLYCPCFSELAEFRQNQVDVVINLGDSIDRASRKKNSSLAALSTVLERQHSKLESIPIKFVLGMVL